MNPWFGTPVNPLDAERRARRLVERLGRGGRAERRRGRHRARHRHGRVDPQPGRVVRRRRAEDDLRAHPGGRHLAAGAVDGHDRADGRDRRPGGRGHGAARARLRPARVARPARSGRVRGLEAEPWIDDAIDAAPAGRRVRGDRRRAARLGRPPTTPASRSSSARPTGRTATWPTTTPTRSVPRRAAGSESAARSTTPGSRRRAPSRGRGGPSWPRCSAGSSCSPSRRSSSSPFRLGGPGAPEPDGRGGQPARATRRSPSRCRRRAASRRACSWSGPDGREDAAGGGRGRGRGGRGRLERVLVSRSGVLRWCKRSVAARSRRGRPIELGGALVTLVEPHKGHEVAYNRWYERDHFYAGCMIGAWTISGVRYVCTARPEGPPLPGGHPGRARTTTPARYLALYWVLNGRFGEWIQWGTEQVKWLIDDDRMFPHRDHIHTLMYKYRGRVRAARRRAGRARPRPPLAVPRDGRRPAGRGRRPDRRSTTGSRRAASAPPSARRSTRSPMHAAARRATCPRDQGPTASATSGSSTTTCPTCGTTASPASARTSRPPASGSSSSCRRSAPPCRAPTPTPTSSGSRLAVGARPVSWSSTQRAGHLGAGAGEVDEVGAERHPVGARRRTSPPGQAQPARSTSARAGGDAAARSAALRQSVSRWFAFGLVRRDAVGDRGRRRCGRRWTAAPRARRSSPAAAVRRARACTRPPTGRPPGARCRRPARPG